MRWNSNTHRERGKNREKSTREPNIGNANRKKVQKSLSASMEYVYRAQNIYIYIYELPSEPMRKSAFFQQRDTSDCRVKSNAKHMQQPTESERERHYEKNTLSAHFAVCIVHFVRCRSEYEFFWFALFRCLLYVLVSSSKFCRRHISIV